MTAREVQKDLGLTSLQALENIKKYGANQLKLQKFTPITIFIRQFKGNYLLYVLVLCTFISFLLGERVSSLYIFAMVLVSATLGFWNEYSAQKVVERLFGKITPKALVKRDQKVIEIPIDQITIGDVVLFSTGSVIPADLLVLEAKNLQVNQSVLTGESSPVEKHPNDTIHMGTNVESGHGVGVVTQIGEATTYGKIAKNLSFLKPETSFQLGIKSFSNMLVRVILITALGIFVINSGLGKPWLTSLMFALAIAVGLTPEFLPLVVSVSLSHGAGRLAKKHVVVKQLVAVENLGNMDVLCCDKTGTLTEGKIQLTDYFSVDGRKDIQVPKKAYLSCSQTLHHTHLIDPINRAIVDFATSQGIVNTLGKVVYLDSEPFDYDKRASYNLVKFEGEHRLLVKGAFDAVIKFCTQSDNELDKNNKKITELINRVDKISRLGFRVVAVAEKLLPTSVTDCAWKDVSRMKLVGVLVFSDPPKKDAKYALESLENLYVDLKVLTGDSESVALKVCTDVGLTVKGVILGSQIDKFTDQQLEKAVVTSNLFVKLSPENKVAVIKTLQRLGHTVGFLGDGINDAPALHAADVGISVNTASDVAKQSASIVLLRKSLNVLLDGVIEGRKIFNNTVKYILMGTSSNFGNMFSASLASPVLPFLPMMPVQILLNNTLYDLSQLTIPSDRVDQESLLKPRHWDIGFIKKYMLFFGPISSIFDFITFGILLFVFQLDEKSFQTGWFMESLITQTMIIFVVRTAKFPFIKSLPSKPLAISALVVSCLAVVLVITPISSSFGFAPLPILYFVFLVLITLVYLFFIDLLKLLFIRKFKVWN